jgi:hypothetical protein
MAISGAFEHRTYQSWAEQVECPHDFQCSLTQGNKMAGMLFTAEEPLVSAQGLFYFLVTGQCKP